MEKRVTVLSFWVCICLIFSFLSAGCKKGQAFEVSDGTLEKSGMGYALSAEKDKAAVALKKIEPPFKNIMTVKGKMKSLLPDGTRNGYIAFGENPKKFAQAGIRIGGMMYVIEGHYVEKMEAPQKFDQKKVFDVELNVDLKGKTVTLKIDGNEVKTKMKYAPKSIEYVGYVAANTKTEFSDLQISGE